MKTIQDVRMIDFPSVVGDGSLVPVELESKIPFDVKRIFYVYDVGTLEKRGPNKRNTHTRNDLG